MTYNHDLIIHRLTGAYSLARSTHILKHLIILDMSGAAIFFRGFSRPRDE
jgi:hypothetical protein